jgi:hypothetical protein
LVWPIVTSFLLVILLASPLIVEGVGADPTLSNQGWTMPGGNPQHSGTSIYNTTDVQNKMQWTFKAQDPDVPGSSYSFLNGLMIGPDGTIYTQICNSSNGGSDGLYAINPDGTVKWFSTAAAGGPNSFGSDMTLRNMAIGQDGTIYCIVNIATQERGTHYDFHLRAIDPDNGTLKWEYISRGKGLSSETQPIVSPNGEILFREVIPSDGFRTTPFSVVDTGVSSITSLYPNGSLAWNTPIPVSDSAIAVSANATIYAMSNTGYLYTLLPNGTIQSNVTVSVQGDIQSLSLDDSGNIYVVVNNAFYKFNANGLLGWKFDSADVGINIPPIIDKQGNVYLAISNTSQVPGEDGDMGAGPGLLSLSPNGEVRWTIEHENGRMAMSADGVIYIASADHFTALRYDGSTLWQIDVLQAPSPISYGLSEGGGQDVAIGPNDMVYFLGELQLSFGGQGYVLAITGTPSVSDPGMTEQFVIPLIAVTVMAILLILLFYIKNHNAHPDRPDRDRHHPHLVQQLLEVP